MEDAKDRIQYEGGWTRLVDSLEEFWTRFFDEGKNTFSAFQPWAGAIAANSEQGESWYEFSRIPGCLMRTVWASSFIVSPRLADKSVAYTADYS